MYLIKNGYYFKDGAKITAEEFFASMPPESTNIPADAPETQTMEEKVSALEEQNEMLTECILELSELLYN